jgi:hypothetical protein
MGTKGIGEQARFGPEGGGAGFWGWLVAAVGEAVEARWGAGIQRWLAVAVGENEEEGGNGNGQGRWLQLRSGHTANPVDGLTLRKRTRLAVLLLATNGSDRIN